MSAPSKGLETRLALYFQANPHEELTVDDVTIKFSISRRRAEGALGAMTGRGDLKRVSVYSVHIAEAKE